MNPTDDLRLRLERIEAQLLELRQTTALFARASEIVELSGELQALAETVNSGGV